MSFFNLWFLAVYKGKSYGAQDERSLEMIHRYCFYCSLHWYSCDPNTCANLYNVCL